MRRLSWRGCEGSPDRLPGVVHVVGQACGNAPAGNDRSRIGRLAADPRPPRGEVAVDDVGVEGDDSVDTRSAHNLGRWCGGLDGQHGWPDGGRHRRPPEQEKTYCASSEGRHFRHLPSVCRRRMCSAYSCDQAHQAGDRRRLGPSMPVAAAPRWVTTLAMYQTAREGPGLGRRV